MAWPYRPAAPGRHALKDIRHTVCRICHAGCDLVVELSEGGEPRKVYGNKHNPTFEGYSCIKGREMPSYRASPERLLTSMARQPDGTLAPIGAEQAMDEIAGRIDAIVKQYGPAAVACYSGTQSFQNYPAVTFTGAFIQAIGSPWYFDTFSIDQPGKGTAPAIHGTWPAGTYTSDEVDAWLLVGNNPLVSMIGGFSVNPAAKLRRAQARKMQLVVIDPRRTEVAAKADIHLQPRPGHSAPILAAMLHVILDEGLYDADFVAQHVKGLDQLKAAVAGFDPETVAEAAGIPAADLIAAARIYGGARRANANIGTGPNMSGHCTLVEYLAMALMTVCGHRRRAGEVRPNPGVLVNPLPAVAQAYAGGSPRIEGGTRMHVRDLAQTACGLPTAALADEILLDDENERIRVLIVVGGNPVSALPDQIKSIAAMKRLDLLVCIDPVLGATTHFADYVIAPKLSLETITTSIVNEALAFGGGGAPGMGFEGPYAQWADPVVPPPAGADLLEEWEFFHGVAQRLGLNLSIPGFAWLKPANAAHMVDLDMAHRPDTGALLERLFEGSPVPLSRIRAQTGGAHYSREPDVVAPAPLPPESRPRLNVGDEAMMAELVAMAGESGFDAEFPFALISRRLHNIHNSVWHKAPNLAKREPHNAAYMHPSDLRNLGLAEGGPVEIVSARAAIDGFAVPADDIRPGTISMAHCWGDLPDTPDEARRFGSSTSRLIFNDRDYDPLTGIPRMSNIAVAVRPRVASPLSEGRPER